MKMMWFTLCNVAAGVAAGVGVGVGPPLMPTPCHPERRLMAIKGMNKAQHVRGNLFTEVIAALYDTNFELFAWSAGPEAALSSFFSDVTCGINVGCWIYLDLTSSAGVLTS